MLTMGVPAGVRRRIVRVTPASIASRARRLARGETRVQRVGRRLSSRLAMGRADWARHWIPEPARAALSAVSVGGTPGLAHTLTTFRANETFAQMAAQVADALEAGGVDYFFLPVEQERRRTIVVADTLRRAALEALRAGLARTGTYAAVVDGDRVKRAFLIERRLPRTPSTLRLFQLQVTPDGRHLSGAELGCTIQFWRAADESTPFNTSGEPIPRGSLILERRTAQLPTFIPPPELEPTVGPVDGRPRPTPSGLAQTHLFRVTQPVDVVYTWVDGSDPAWQARKDAALVGASPDQLHAFAANDSRFVSRDELRYSLRSLDMYAGWVRHIFLVTDDQVPAWLDTDNPRLTVVSHKELFEERGRLPTFNSHAIESQLHHIDGLSENFLYLNDDMFFGKPARPSQFVLANGIAKFFLSPVKVTPGPPLPSDLPITSAAKNNRDLLVQRFGRTVTEKFQHAPYSLRRSVLYDLEREFPAEIEQTACSQFRNAGDISVAASLAHYYGFLTGRAIQSTVQYAYIDIGWRDAHDRLEALLRRRDQDVFCVNDHDCAHLDPEQQHELVQGFLERYFPLPSQFEV